MTPILAEQQSGIIRPDRLGGSASRGGRKVTRLSSAWATTSVLRIILRERGCISSPVLRNWTYPMAALERGDGRRQEMESERMCVRASILTRGITDSQAKKGLHPSSLDPQAESFATPTSVILQPAASPLLIQTTPQPWVVDQRLSASSRLRSLSSIYTAPCLVPESR